MDKANLICLPFAGGNKYSYRSFEEIAPVGIRVVTLEYPGRGIRVTEPFCLDMEHLIDDLMAKMAEMTLHPYAFFGHSMGAIVACLLTRKILECQLRPPIQLFLTGASAPSSRALKRKKVANLPREDFVAELRHLEGFAPEVIENEELMAFFEPIIRADFKLCEDYQYRPHKSLPVPFTVITGSTEEHLASDLIQWQQETSIKIDYRTMEGGHFFIFQHVKELIGLMKDEIITQEIRNKGKKNAK